jgi:ABC-2 type transport system ATP-binding protein
MFGDYEAVKGLTFELKAGEILGFLGPNGAGKTTTIQMLLGMITPTSGEITVFGNPLANPKYRETIMSQVNFSSTYINLPLGLSIFENLMVFAHLYGVKNPKSVVEAKIKAFDLGEYRNQQTKALSSGQLTRLHLAKATLNNPKLLFLDEPTASLDPDTADRIRQLLLEMRRETGMSILMTSHNMPEMQMLSDRIIFLNKGELILEGTPQTLLELTQTDDLEALFLDIARGKKVVNHAQ